MLIWEICFRPMERRVADHLIWTGTGEQHSINLVAGLSARGKKVYVYMVA